MNTTTDEPSVHGAEFAERVRRNQRNLAYQIKATLRLHRLWFGLLRFGRGAPFGRKSDVTVLLLEAGGTDDVPSVIEAGQWLLNLGSERDWGFRAQPNPTSTDAPFL